jgi:hypothetical protein
MIELGDFIDNYRILSKVADSNLSSTYVAEHTPAGTPPVLLTLWHGITLTANEDIQTFLNKARDGVILRNSQTIPLLAAQLHHESPYIVIAFNTQTSTSLNAHTQFIDQVVDNRRVLHPDDTHSSIDAFLSIFCTSLQESTPLDSSTASAGDQATHTAPSVKPRLKQWIHKPRSRRSYAIASILLLLVLLAGSIALLIIFLPANAATVTITPTSEHIAHTYPISLVTGNPTASQIKARTISYTTPPQSQTVPATGKGHHDATKAQGLVLISQIHLFNASDNNSSVGPSDVQANDGTMITIGVFTATEGGTVTVNASASTAGQGGNIFAYDINGFYGIYEYDQFNIQGRQIGTAYNQNPGAFTGGLDGNDYTYVQQQDIDGAANPLSAQLTPSAQQQAQQQLQPNEQLVHDITCANSINTDQKAQDTADSVTVTVQVTCSGIAYNKQDLLTAAINAQKADEITQFGTSYQLSGDITTGIPNLSTSSQDGSATYEVPTDGIWVFQIDKAQQQELARSIAGHPQWDATNQLLKRKGIKSVAITTAGSIGTALPTSPGSIKFTIVHIPGLTSR